MTLRRADRRRHGLVLTALAVALGGVLLAQLDGGAPATAVPVEGAAAAEPRRSFDAAVVLLHARRHAEAAVLLERVIGLAPALPEARVNLGFALLGLRRHADARAAFEAAIGLRAGQANAYYGLAMAHEASGDLELAIGAMRSYLHLARDEREAHLARARAALWEWESTLGQARGR